jgi:hypothetical protein
MPATYEPIATTTLGSAAANIQFSTIPGTYTDLVVTLLVNTTSVDARIVRCTFNGDTGANYSATRLQGNGTAAAASASTGQANIPLTLNATTSTTIPTYYQFSVFSYAGSTNKTVLAEGNADKNGSGVVDRTVGLWQNTAAITTINITPSSGNFNTGTVATVYGIKSA